jgi:hypothetical protein
MTLTGEKKIEKNSEHLQILLFFWPALEIVLMNFHCPKAKTFSQTFLEKSGLSKIFGKNLNNSH